MIISVLQDRRKLPGVLLPQPLRVLQQPKEGSKWGTMGWQRTQDQLPVPWIRPAKDQPCLQTPQLQTAPHTSPHLFIPDVLHTPEGKAEKGAVSGVYVGWIMAHCETTVLGVWCVYTTVTLPQHVPSESADTSSGLPSTPAR